MMIPLIRTKEVIYQIFDKMVMRRIEMSILMKRMKRRRMMTVSLSIPGCCNCGGWLIV